jgi:protein-glutamine gamma-glutamyltransferase
VSGESNTNAIGTSGEFVGLREYRPGDPLRQIHWKSWARTGRPIVKELEDTFYPRYGLVLDTLSTERNDTCFEEAVSVAASFALTIDTRESLLDLMFIKNEAHVFTAGRGVERAEKLLEVLAGVTPTRSGDHRALAQLVLKHGDDLTSCVVILNGWDDSRAELLRDLERGGVTCVPILIGHGPRPAGAPGYWLESGHIGRDLMRLPLNFESGFNPLPRLIYHSPHPPPRLLLGTSLLFWGAMTGRPMLGLVLALVVEGRHWTRIRWDFDDDACGKAWHFTSIGIVLAAVLIWLDGNRYTALPNLLSWLPALMIPMQFIQSYGMRESMPMSAFSFLARRRRERCRRFGLIEETSSFNFGNAMFAMTMVGATVGSKSSSGLFLPGLVILGGWMLMSKGRGRPLLLLPVLALAGLMALSGRHALEKAEEWLGSAASQMRGNFDPNFVSTLIGTAGTIQQSEDIAWRLKPAEKTPPPRLLRTASFNNFLGANWRNQRLDNSDFTDLDTRLIGDEAYYLLGESGETQDPANMPYFTLRGSAAAETPLPLPGDSAMLRDFALDGVERNSFGTVRVFPKHPVIDGTVFWKGGGNPENPPIENEDFQIPMSEREFIHSTLEELGINSETPLREQLAILRTFFHRDFRYTRDLTIRHPYSRITGRSAISRFLTETRAGHCEYFATAAVLMLRAGGIPARYATGYAVMERDVKHGGYVLRGTHGHAWCRVWDQDAGMWIDFDPTRPTGWAAFRAGSAFHNVSTIRSSACVRIFSCGATGPRTALR